MLTMPAPLSVSAPTKEATSAWPNYQPDLPHSVRAGNVRDDIRRLRPCSADAARRILEAPSPGASEGASTAAASTAPVSTAEESRVETVCTSPRARARPCSATSHRAALPTSCVLLRQRPLSAACTRRPQRPGVRARVENMHPQLRFGSGLAGRRLLIDHTKHATDAASAPTADQVQRSRAFRLRDIGNGDEDIEVDSLTPELRARLRLLFVAASMNLPLHVLEPQQSGARCASPKRPSGSPPIRRPRGRTQRLAAAIAGKCTHDGETVAVASGSLHDAGITKGGRSSRSGRPCFGVHLATAIALARRERRRDESLTPSPCGYTPTTSSAHALLRLFAADAAVQNLLPEGASQFAAETLRQLGRQVQDIESFERIVVRAMTSAAYMLTADKEWMLLARCLTEAVVESDAPCVLVEAGQPRERVLCASQRWYNLCEYDSSQVEGKSFSEIRGFQGALTTEASKLQFRCLAGSTESVLDDLQIINYTGRHQRPLHLHIRVQLFKLRGQNRVFLCSITDHKDVKIDSHVESHGLESC